MSTKPATHSNMPTTYFNSHLWRKDGNAITILMCLYVLQGIPLGLTDAIPFFLTNKGVSYKDQALFSFTSWPFCLKLLWAPFVDSIFIRKFGRRKSWLLPVQYFIGLMFLYLSKNIDNLMDLDNNGSIMKLTVIFFTLTLGAATQDIAVDGWCLTMLSKENVGWASTCNTVGQAFGCFLGQTIFLALESVDFSNKYFRPIFGLPTSEIGVVTLSGFLHFWGIVFIVVTSLVAIFKSEKSEHDSDYTVKETYLMLWNITKKKLMLLYIGFAMTSRIGLTAVDSVGCLKIIEKGLPKENLALMAVPLMPIQIFLPILISKYTAGPRPLNTWVANYIPRITMGVIFVICVYYTGQIGKVSPDRQIGLDYSATWYMILTLIGALQLIFSTCHFVSIIAFHAKVSDPSIGGTSMTLMNTVSNMGGAYLRTFSLYFVDKLSKFNCNLALADKDKLNNLTITNWNDKSLKDTCTNVGGTFETIREGFYIEVFITSILGVLWLIVAKKYILFMDTHRVEDWHEGTADTDAIYEIGVFKKYKHGIKNFRPIEKLKHILRKRTSYTKLENDFS